LGWIRRRVCNALYVRVGEEAVSTLVHDGSGREQFGSGSGDWKPERLETGELRRHPRPWFYRLALIGPRNVMPTLERIV